MNEITENAPTQVKSKQFNRVMSCALCDQLRLDIFSDCAIIIEFIAQ